MIIIIATSIVLAPVLNDGDVIQVYSHDSPLIITTINNNTCLDF